MGFALSCPLLFCFCAVVAEVKAKSQPRVFFRIETSVNEMSLIENWAVESIAACEPCICVKSESGVARPDRDSNIVVASNLSPCITDIVHICVPMELIEAIGIVIVIKGWVTDIKKHVESLLAGFGINQELRGLWIFESESLWSCWHRVFEIKQVWSEHRVHKEPTENSGEQNCYKTTEYCLMGLHVVKIHSNRLTIVVTALNQFGQFIWVEWIICVSRNVMLLSFILFRHLIFKKFLDFKTFCNLSKIISQGITQIKR